MGSFAVILALVILVPLVIFLLSRRAAGPGQRGRQGQPVAVEEPAADEPTPGAGTVNRAGEAAARRVPPS